MSLKNNEKQTRLLTDNVVTETKRVFNLMLVVTFLLQLILPVMISVDASTSDDAIEPKAVEVQAQEENSDADIESPDVEEEPAEEVEEVEEPETPPAPAPEEKEDPGENVVEEPVTDPEENTNEEANAPPASETPEEDEEEAEVVEEEEKEEEKDDVATTLSFEADGIRVEVFGEAGVIPDGTELSLEPISEEEADLYLKGIEENTDVLMGYVSLFNIHLLDEAGNKIQPNGEVSVSFYGLDHIQPSDDVFVYHAEIAQGRQMASDSSNVMLEDFTPSFENDKVSFNTDHFSIYIVGTNIRRESSGNRYQMYVGDTVELEERNVNHRSYTWSTTSSGIVDLEINPTDKYKATVTAIGAGTVSVRYQNGTSGWIIVNPTYNHFYIAVSTNPNHDALDPAVQPVKDPDALPPGTVAAEKTARWVDYTNRIAEINLSVEGMPVISGSDVILVMDKSGSMTTPHSTRIGPARDASNEFINGLLGDGNPLNNRVAYIPFSHGSDSGGASATEVAAATSGSVNFSYSSSRLTSYVNQTVAVGGTNYSAALQKAINYAQSRPQSERDRPLYVVFMSDGLPGLQGNSSGSTTWNGLNQANTLKSTYEATIYTVGIQLTPDPPTALSQISSSLNGSVLYQNAASTGDLSPILQTIAGEIKIAGTNAVFKDELSDFFEFYNQAPYNTGDGTHVDGEVTIQVGNINEAAKTYKIYVRLKDDFHLIEDDYPTNTDIHLKYDDVDGNVADKYKDEIGHPHLSVGYGTINVRYVLVNTSGQYITRDTGVVVDPQFRQYVPTQNHSHLFEYEGDTHLEVMENYTVSPTLPSGYALYVAGETIEQEVTWDNTNPTVEFRVVRAPILKEDVIAKKYWVNGEHARPNKWYYQLWRKVTVNGEVMEEPVAVEEVATNSSTVSVTFPDVEQKDSAQNHYTFYVKEGTYVNGTFTEAVPANFVKSGSGLTLTNTYKVPKTGTASATKIWAGGEASDYSAVSLKLWRTTDGTNFTEVLNPNLATTPTTGGATIYQYEWSELEATDESGKAYNFYFTEEEVPDGYERSYSDAIAVAGKKYGKSKSTVTNRKMLMDFTFKKVDEVGNALTGATFKLERHVENGPNVEIANTGTDPMFLYRNLVVGRYTLTEVAAPNGYVLPQDNTWTFEVVWNDTDKKLEIVFDAGDEIDFDEKLGYVIANYPKGMLPETGGPGNSLYTLVGILSLVSLGTIYVWRKKRDEVNQND